MTEARMDARLDATLRRLDVPATPDDAFVQASVTDLLPRVRRARAQDASRMGRLLRDLRLAAGRAWRPAGPRRVAVVAMTLLLAALLIVLLAIFVGSHRRVPPPFGPAANGGTAYDANGHVVIADLDGANPRQITFDAGLQQDPAFSRDGTRLAWRQFDPNGPPETADAVLAEADGSNPITIARAVKGLSHIAWSPDGRFVAFSGSIDGGPGSGWIAPSDGSSPPKAFTTIPGAWDPTWSPDGTRLAIGGDPGRLFVVNRDGANLWRVNHNDYTEIGERGEIAEWSPDGTMLVFTAITGDGNGDFEREVYVVALDGSPEYILSRNAITGRDASWSPDGTRIAYMHNGTGLGPIPYITDPTGKGVVHPLPGFYGWYQPIWSPDGTKIVVTDDRPGLGNVDGPAVRVILDVAGKAPPIVIAAPGTTPDQVPDWAASWQRLALP